MQFKIMGGDKRFEILENLLIENGHMPDDNARFIILPLPLTRDGETLNAPREKHKIKLSDIILAADEGDIFFGGLVPGDFKAKILAAGAVIYDYNALDRFAVKLPFAMKQIGQRLLSALPLLLRLLRDGALINAVGP